MSYTIYQKKGRKSLYVRFVLGGVETNKTLKTLDRRKAKADADVIYEEARKAHYSPKVVVPSTVIYGSLGELCCTYKANHALLGIQKLTAHRNARLLIRVVAPDLTKAEADALSMEKVTKMALQAHQSRELAKGRDADSINSDIRQARSLFSAGAQTLYENLKFKIPSGCLEFAKAKMLKTSGAKGFKAISPKTLTALDHGLSQLISKNADMWKTVALVRSGGPRNREIFHMRGFWFEIQEDLAILEIRNYDERVVHHDGVNITIPKFSVKNGHERSIAFPRAFYDFLKPELDWQHLVLPDGLPTQRYNLIYRETSSWVRRFIKDRGKSLYELRKQAGSQAAAIGGLEAAQHLLGHKLVSTTKAYYHAFLKPAAALNLNLGQS